MHLLLLAVMACTGPDSKDEAADTAKDSGAGETDETGDSSTETGDSSTETGDSSTETGDSSTETGDTGPEDLSEQDETASAHIIWGVINDIGIGDDLVNAGDPEGDGTDGLYLSGTRVTWYVNGAPSDPSVVVDQVATGSVQIDLGPGSGASSGGDLNGDGSPDLALGDPTAGLGGVAYLFAGPITGSLTQDGAIADLIGTKGTQTGNASAMQDLNGDGTVELIVAGTGELAVYSAPSGVLTTDDAEAVVTGDSAYYLPFDLGDGDLGVVVRGYTVAGFSSPPPGAVSVSDGDLQISLPGVEGVIGGTDLDGDGHADLVAAAPTASSHGGEVYVFMGPLTGSLGADDAATTITHSDSGQLGTAQTLTDLDRDGTPDLILGAPFAEGGGGQVFGFYGPLAAGSLSEADAELWWTGAQGSGWGGWDDDGLGAGLLGSADLNGDSEVDLVLGAPSASEGVSAAYLWLAD